MSLGEIDLKCRKLVEMVVQMFYEPKYWVAAVNLLDMGENGATEEKLAARMKMTVKDCRKLLAKLRNDGIVHSRTTKNAEAEEQPIIPLSKLHPRLHQQQKYLKPKKGETIWFYKFQTLVHVISYRWNKMQEKLRRPTQNFGERVCPNPDCANKGKKYRMEDIFHMRGPDKVFRCPAETCRLGTNNEGKALGIALVITEASKEYDAKKLEDRKKRANIQMRPIIHQVKAVEKHLRQQQAEFENREEEEEEDEDANWKKRVTLSNTASTAKRNADAIAAKGSAEGDPGYDAEEAKRLEKEERERKEREEKQREKEEDLFQKQLKALQQQQRNEQKESKTNQTKKKPENDGRFFRARWTANMPEPRVEVGGQMVEFSKVTLPMIELMTTKEYREYAGVASSIADQLDVDDDDDEDAFEGMFDDI